MFEPFQAMYQVSVLLILNFQGRNILSLRHESNDFALKVKNTIIFNAFVLCQVSPSLYRCEYVIVALLLSHIVLEISLLLSDKYYC
jgi:hypothetical protein